MPYLLAAILALTMLAACSEKPPRQDPERVQAYNVENGPGRLVERTLNQGESERMGH
jgi:hypothetical protein